MNRAPYGRPLFVTLAIVSMLLLIVGTVAAKERQLAGVHLNDHAIALLDIYGPPDGVVTGPPGNPFPEVQEAADMPGMAGPRMMPGAGAAPPRGAQRQYWQTIDRGMESPGSVPMGQVMEEMWAAEDEIMGRTPPGVGGFPGAPPGAPGAPGMPGTAGQVQAAIVPNWALPVYIETQPGDMMWIYQRGPITLGFLLDLDGYVQDIAVAADRCNYVRTANWQPHKYVKLGDHYSRVLQRYGWADETNTYTASGLGGGAAAPSVSFSGTDMTFSRDCVLRYTEGGNNIDFTLHDFRVVRIHIWD